MESYSWLFTISGKCMWDPNAYKQSWFSWLLRAGKLIIPNQMDSGIAQFEKKNNLKEILSSLTVWWFSHGFLLDVGIIPVAIFSDVHEISQTHGFPFIRHLIGFHISFPSFLHFQLLKQQKRSMKSRSQKHTKRVSVSLTLASMDDVGSTGQWIA